MVIHKMILYENMRPVAVQIPYNEWLEIEMAIGEKKEKNHVSLICSAALSFLKTP